MLIQLHIVANIYMSQGGDSIMFTKDRKEIRSSEEGNFPTLNCLYSTIPRETRMHMERVGRYADILFKELYRHNKEYVVMNMGEEFAGYSEEVFRMHDIGRHYIPVSILYKVSKLTDEEFMIIKNHTINAIKAEKSIYYKPYPTEVMNQLLDIAVYHHEHWNGKGYLEGRSGVEIPLGARICAIADTYDGIISWKPYKRTQVTKEEAMKIICSESGKQFQPDLIEIFKSCAASL